MAGRGRDGHDLARILLLPPADGPPAGAAGPGVSADGSGADGALHRRHPDAASAGEHGHHPGVQHRYPHRQRGRV